MRFGSVSGLQEMGDPILNGDARIAFQTMLPKPTDISVLLVELASGPKSVMPELCEATIANRLPGVTICDYENKCSAPTSSRIVLCNLETIDKLVTLFAAIHDPELIHTYMISDRGYMELARKIAAEPSMVAAEIKDSPTEDHLMEHMFYFMTVILAHELHHIAENEQHDRVGDSAAVEQVSGADTDQANTSAAERICRNYLQFEANGFKLLGQRNLEGLANVSISPSDLKAIGTTREIWRVRSRRITTAKMLVKIIRKMVHEGASSLDDAAIEKATLTLSTAAMYYWYVRLASFARASCSANWTRTTF